MHENLFANGGQIGQFICAAISAMCAALSLVRTIPRRYRLWLGGAAIVGALCLVRWIFDKALVQPWTDCGMVVLAAAAAYCIGKSKSEKAAQDGATLTGAFPSTSALAPVEILQVKLHVSKDERVVFKKKLVITLRNGGQHDLIVGPKGTWVPGAISVHRLEQLVWELEPQQGWESDGWKWQEAESSELYVAQGVAFRTWVALNENATEAEVERLRGRLGNLRVPLRLKIGNFQISL